MAHNQGSELLVLHYTPPFDFFTGRASAHRVLAAGYVTTDEGTGLVHLASAFGEEDKTVAVAAADAAAFAPLTDLIRDEVNVRSVLDTVVTAELAPEGIARDLVRVVQQARRQAALSVTDRIVLTVDAPETVLAAARQYEQFIAGEVLARRIEYGPVEQGFAGSVGDGLAVRVAVVVVSE